MPDTLATIWTHRERHFLFISEKSIGQLREVAGGYGERFIILGHTTQHKVGKYLAGVPFGEKARPVALRGYAWCCLQEIPARISWVQGKCLRLLYYHHSGPGKSAFALVLAGSVTDAPVLQTQVSPPKQTHSCAAIWWIPCKKLLEESKSLTDWSVLPSSKAWRVCFVFCLWGKLAFVLPLMVPGRSFADWRKSSWSPRRTQAFLFSVNDFWDTFCCCLSRQLRIIIRETSFIH